MHLALEIIGLLCAAALLAGLAGRVGAPAPLVLTAAGLVASFVPGIPEYPLEPEVVLIGFLPPLLYASALRTPVVDLRRNRLSIGLLSVALVLVTVVAVAGVTRAVLPGIGLAAAVALGAVVAPPDAVAATAIARRIGMPRRVVTILEGESLLNDATALVTLRTAVVAIGGTVTAVEVARSAVLAVVSGLAVGLVLAAAAGPVRQRLREEPVLDTSLALLVPYLAYAVAEELHGSGVLAVVVAGLVLGHRSPDIQSAASRVTEQVIWRCVQYLLEAVVFLLIGLQLRTLLRAAAAGSVSGARTAALCAATVAAVVAVRVLWLAAGVAGSRGLGRLRARRAAAHGAPRDEQAAVVSGSALPARQAVLVSWAGMRGVVTLAAAFALPEDTPRREALVLAAFAVVAATLLLQGSSLGWVARRLRVPGPDHAEDALAQAIVVQRASAAGLLALEGCRLDGDPPEAVEDLRQWEQRFANAAWERLGPGNDVRTTPAAAIRRLRTAMLAAERKVVVEAARSGTVPHDVVDPVLRRIDQEEALLIGIDDSVQPSADRLLAAPASSAGCAHLRSAGRPPAPAAAPDACQGCVAVGAHSWVHLRMCLTCGFVGCCDSSPLLHATGHYEETGHPVMRSVELGEAWRWCYVDELVG